MLLLHFWVDVQWLRAARAARERSDLFEHRLGAANVIWFSWPDLLVDGYR